MLIDTARFESLGTRVQLFDSRTRGFGTGRSILALAQLTLLVGTHTSALFASVLGEASSPHCSGLTQASVFCVAGGSHLLADQCVAALILAITASGWRPRWTAIPHAWVAFSIASSISLPDGGEAIAQIVTALLIPIALVDGRAWHWCSPKTPLSDPARAVSYAFMLMLRYQVAYIYIYSAVAKFGVAEWANGSAEYYYVRDTIFGAEGLAARQLHDLTMNSVVTLAMTWGSLLIEIVIGVLLVVHRARRLALGLDLVLHIGIIVTLGLWSFALVMIGAVTVATYGQRDSLKSWTLGSAHYGAVAGSQPSRVASAAP